MTHIPVPEPPFDPSEDEDSDTMTTVKAVTRTVDDLIMLLGDMPADANVALQTRHGEADEFTVAYDDESGWVILQG